MLSVTDFFTTVFPTAFAVAFGPSYAFTLLARSRCRFLFVLRSAPSETACPRTLFRAGESWRDPLTQRPAFFLVRAVVYVFLVLPFCPPGVACGSAFRSTFIRSGHVIFLLLAY